MLYSTVHEDKVSGLHFETAAALESIENAILTKSNDSTFCVAFYHNIFFPITLFLLLRF